MLRRRAGAWSGGLIFGWVAAVVVAFAQAGAWGLIAQIDVGRDAWMLRAYLGITVALGAGTVVGAAVSVGSRGRGGLLLQGMAAGLVYVASVASLAVWSAGSVGAMALRSVLGLARGPMDVPRMVDTVFAMGLAWVANREGRRMAVSGPFGYARR